MDQTVELFGHIMSSNRSESFSMIGFNAGPTLSVGQIASFDDLAPRERFRETQRRMRQIAKSNVLVFAKLVDDESPEIKRLWWKHRYFPPDKLELWAISQSPPLDGMVVDPETIKNNPAWDLKTGVEVLGEKSIDDVRLIFVGPYQVELITVVYEYARVPDNPDLYFSRPLLR